MEKYFVVDYVDIKSGIGDRNMIDHVIEAYTIGMAAESKGLTLVKQLHWRSIRRGRVQVSAYVFLVRFCFFKCLSKGDLLFALIVPDSPILPVWVW